MSRNRYDDAFGVCPIEWHEGEPARTGNVVFVEVWRSSLSNIDPTWANPTRSVVHISAVVEARVFVGDAWHVVGHKGAIRVAGDGEVRRWAHFHSRSWNKSITLDGWDAERAS